MTPIESNNLLLICFPLAFFLRRNIKRSDANSVPNPRALPVWAGRLRCANRSICVHRSLEWRAIGAARGCWASQNKEELETSASPQLFHGPYLFSISKFSDPCGLLEASEGWLCSPQSGGACPPKGEGWRRNRAGDDMRVSVHSKDSLHRPPAPWHGGLNYRRRSLSA